MLDFVKISISTEKKGVLIVAPEFLVKSTRDLMIKGHSFYAVWDEEIGMWTQNLYRVQEIIDEELAKAAAEERERVDDRVNVKYLRNYSNHKWDEFLKYCKSSPDNYKELNNTILFSNSKIRKTDYATKTLPYNLVEDGDISAYEELVNVLYEPNEREKFEWAIGSIFTGKSRYIQKFFVFYGSAGTGKSTVMNIMQELFSGYYTIFESKSLASNNNTFAMEQFHSNPLVAIQHDGDLSRIEDNTKLNSLISHEEMNVNEKFKSPYVMRFNAMLFMGTNKPVMITDAKSGIIRRLVDISPTGNIVTSAKYNDLMSEIKFELGAIADHCIKVFKEKGVNYYDGYRSRPMIGATNEFYNYVEDNYEFFIREESVTLSEAWRRYKLYCEDANVTYPMRKMIFKNELKNYFEEFIEHTRNASNVYSGFIRNKFDSLPVDITDDEAENWLDLTKKESLLDDICKDCPAQYSTKDGIPSMQWSKVETTLKDIDTKKEHYVRLPDNYIVIDFDFKDDNGKKDANRNLEEARKYPKTYAEFSKSGGGIHLHYIWSGDVTELANRINDDIEIKKFTGKSALRRKLSGCNDISIAMLNSGLPLKKGGSRRMIDFKGFESEKALRNHIIKCMRKEHHGATKPEIDFIYASLEQAYESGIHYDLTTLRPAVLSFAMGSTNHAPYCLELVNKMKFASKEASLDDISEDERQLAFYDVEVFPNLFLVNWKTPGEDKKCVRMVNPTSDDIEKLVKKYNLIGFNCRRYDNHIMYARMMGYNNRELFDLSQKIVGGNKNAFFMEAYNLSYTDVYDFASAGNKKSLKKWEIELDIHHQELGLPWDKEVPENQWTKVAEYCDNDVISTEKVFNHLKSDWIARQILSRLSGLSLNASTNQHTTKFIFGNDRHPQSQFLYRDLSQPVKELPKDVEEFLYSREPYMMEWWKENTDSLLPYFPGYKFDAGKSVYKGIEVGEGGYVYSEPSMETNVGLDDVASMHPHSAINECLFGVEYTSRYASLVDGRIDIKHSDWEDFSKLYNGALDEFVEQVKNGEITSKDLAGGLKTAINAVYGLTKASFDHPFRDIRNKDNIVAKRGALFMVDLMEAVKAQGWKVMHIKTDSIKIPDISQEKIDFVNEFGKRYGYEFEWEDTYERLCLVNDAVYIAKYKEPHNDIWWTATGAEFKNKYVFKKLFSHQEIDFKDLKETKEVRVGALYLDMNEELEEGEHDYHFIGRIGAFVPILPGNGGGELFQIDGDNVSYASGAKGWRWMEAEMVKTLGLEDKIDYNYYDLSVDEAFNHLNAYGDADRFINDDKAYFGVLSFMDVKGDGNDIPFFNEKEDKK